MSAGPASPPPALGPAVFKLLRLRWLLFVNGFRFARPRNKVLSIIVTLFGALLLLGFFIACWSTLAYLRAPELARVLGEINPFFESLPVLLLQGAFGGILFISFGVLLQALYLAGDMDLLLSAPVPMRAVFVSKLLEAILPNLALFGLVALPILFGLGAAAHYHWLYYPLVILALVALALAAAGLAGLLVMLVVRLFPARRTAEVLGFLGVVLSILFSQSFQFANLDQVSRGQLRETLRLLTRFDTPWLPTAWAGRGLVAIGRGQWLPGMAEVLLTVGLCGVAFLGSVTAVERLYYAGWAGMQNRRREGKSARAPGAARGSPLERLLPQRLGALVVKDLRVMRRDLHNMSQLVTPLIIGGVYTLMLARDRASVTPGRGAAPTWFFASWESLLVYGNIAIALFVGWTLVGRLASMALAQEGRSYWVIKAAPVRADELLAAKFAVAYTPGLAVGWLLLGLVSLVQHVPLSIAWFSLAIVALCLAGATGINLAFGVTGANLNWQDPRHMVRTSSGCLGMIASLVYLGVSLFFFLTPPLLVGLAGGLAVAGELVGLGLGGLFSLACAVGPLWWVRAELERLGENP